MSGGVDSSVAAALLLEQGYDVEGLFMKNWDEDDGTDYCTAIEDLEDAQRVCELLGMTLHTANFAAEYWDNVFTDFLHEYRAGRTPNPDILCNREIKFKQFINYAAQLGSPLIATGHYARSCGHDKGRERNFKLLKARDKNKDQTYFLQAVPRTQLQKCLFPLGEWQKKDVRSYAKEHGLHNHDRKDSTGICFIGERRFADFLNRYIDEKPGPIHDLQGRSLGEHPGLPYYTVGQRQGINIGGVKGRPESPWYVVGKAANNTLIVSQNEHDLGGHWLRAQQVNWLRTPSFPLHCQAKIRYRQSDQICCVSEAADGQLLVRFEQPQRAISPGQYVAFYAGEELIGGAKITTCDLRI